MKDRRFLVFAALPLLATGSCSIIYDPVAIKQSGTVVVKPDAPYLCAFDSSRESRLELRFENRGPGSLHIRESVPGAEAQTTLKSGGRMSSSEDTDHIEWILTSDGDATVTYTITSSGGGSLRFVPR